MTANGWRRVPLGEVVSHRKEFIQICEIEQYKRCRVQLGARGIVLRDQIMGCDIKTKKQQVCHSGELLVAEIDAKVGGFGIVPESLEGAIVSSHYFLYAINNGRINKSFLAYYIKTPAFQEQINAQGSTNYSAIRSHQVLEYEIPLPDRKEQDGIVVKLDALSARIDEARSNKEEIEREAEAMLRSAFAQIIGGVPSRTMNDVAPLVRRPVEPKMGEEYPELGIRSFGKGTFHKPAIDYLSVGTKRLYSIAPGDLLFSNVFAWEGAVAVAQPEDGGRYGSHRFITCVPKAGVSTPEFLCFYFLTEEGLRKIGEASPGGAGRNRTLGLTKLTEIEVPVPEYGKQVWFNRLQAKVAAMLAAQKDAESELDALLPSILDKAFKGEL